LNRISRCTVLTLCLLVLARVSPAEPAPAGTPPASTGRVGTFEWLTDSTTVDRWTLPNGLEVVARHVPRARAISVTWGYRIGLDNDPAGQPGWTSLLAEVAFTAPAGGTPERTRDEMESLRPLGWSLRVNPRQTLFTETAAPGQLPGVLHQITERMRGVQVTPANLRRSLVTVCATLQEESRGVTEPDLYWQVREHALGTGPADLARLAEAKDLQRVKPEAVRKALARAYVPANGVLALAGDFTGLDLRALLTAQFGELPAGEPLPELPASRLTATTVVVERPGVTKPVAVVGLFAPVLTDTLHPDFYMSVLVLGAQAKSEWGKPEPPLESRFQYALLDDPDFVRFYPRLEPEDAAKPQGPSARWDALLFDMLAVPVPPGVFAAFRQNVLWLLGGPLPPRLLETMRGDPAALGVLSATTAARTLWGNEEFWSAYRRRFGAEDSIDPTRWREWLAAPHLRASLMVVPQR
jgi:hypothetical protein